MWRSHKTELKEKYCIEGITKEKLLDLKLPEVDANQFQVLVEYWFSTPGMILSVLVLYMFYFYMIYV